MRNTTSNLIRISALILVIIFFVSCKPRNKYNNYFKIGDVNYEIKSGVIINNGETEGGFNLEVRLYDDTKTNFVNFSVVSEQAESVVATNFNGVEGSWVLGYAENGSYENMATLKNGKFSMTRSSGGYIVDFDYTDQYSTKVEGYFKGELSKVDENNLVHKLPDYVLPSEIYDEVTKYIPIYSGVNPPNMTGEYVSAPHALIYESYADNPDSLQFYSDRYLGFIYANKQMNFYGKQYDSLEKAFVEEIQYGVKITGDDDDFTCYYIVDGYVQGYYAQQSFIFSGKKTPQGLENFHVAVILLETSGHPNMYPKLSYRILRDYDGLAESNYWLSGKSASVEAGMTKKNNAFDIWMK